MRLASVRPAAAVVPALMSTLALISTLCGCGGAASGAGESTPAAVAAPEPRAAAVYAAVLRHHLTSWNQGDPVPAVVYVLERAVPDAADPMRGLDAGGGEPIEGAVRERLAADLADLVQVRFVADPATVTTMDSGCPAVDDRGAMLTLAPVPAQGDRLTIGLGDFRACLSGRWQTYVVSHTASGWTVQGTTGPVSIS